MSSNPLKNLKPDMSYINNCVLKIKKILRPYQILILESTVYPGATEKLIKMINNDELKIGKTFVGYSPERENPGTKIFLMKKLLKL